MQTDLDWVGRDLLRLATESKLSRMPTAAEWERIWCAATEWADTRGTVAENAPIDRFVRQHAPGVLRGDIASAFPAPATVMPPRPGACPAHMTQNSS